MKFATRTIHAGQPSEPETGALVAPIFQTSTYEQEAPGHDKGFSYSRTNNPTRQRLEGVLAALEGVEHAAAFASGLAAENAVLQAYLRPGDEIVVLTWLHLSPRDELATHPEDDMSQPLTGVFSTCSPNRPNPIGLHRARILARDGLRIEVDALEAIDGTPVVDVKPALDPPA